MLIRIYGFVLLGAIFCLPALQAQTPDPDKNDQRQQPITPVPAIMPTGGANVSAVDLPQNPISEVQVAADEKPLSGVQQLTPDSTVGVRNFLIPGMTALTQLNLTSSGSSFYGPAVSTYLVGTLDLSHSSNRSQIELEYTGGGMFSSYLNSAIQDLNFTYNTKWLRWSLLLGDEGSYLSESPFGFGGVGGISFLDSLSQFDPGGNFGSILNPSLTPNQTIPTIIVPRLSNTLVSQVEYELGPRSSWTASGSLNTLKFFGAGFIDSNELIFQTGYNYQLNPQSSMALIYRLDGFRFNDFPQTIGNQVILVGYSRYVTGRMTFQIAAGPSMVVLRGPVTGSTNSYSWAMDAALAYHLERTMLLLTYDRFVSGGSGVLIGAQTSQAQASVERKLSARTRGSLALGYAANGNLIRTLAGQGTGLYNSWYATVQVNRQVRPNLAFFIAYGARLQAINSAVCLAPNCGSSSVSHEISAGFNFGLRPVIY